MLNVLPLTLTPVCEALAVSGRGELHYEQGHHVIRSFYQMNPRVTVD